MSDKLKIFWNVAGAISGLLLSLITLVFGLDWYVPVLFFTSFICFAFLAFKVGWEQEDEDEDLF